MGNNTKMGKIGENWAANYIINKLNSRIIKRNHREKSDEVDIIAIGPDSTLIFYEVKTIIRKSRSFLNNAFLPEDNLTPMKLKKISRACRIFAGKHPELINDDKGWQIDLIAIEMDQGEKVLDIRHYENI